jgi:hypothetical protein
MMDFEEWRIWVRGRAAFASSANQVMAFDLKHIPGLARQVQVAARAVLRGLEQAVDGDPEINIRLVFKSEGDFRIATSVATTFPATKSKYAVDPVYAFRENGELKICKVKQTNLFGKGP